MYPGVISAVDCGYVESLWSSSTDLEKNRNYKKEPTH